MTLFNTIIVMYHTHRTLESYKTYYITNMIINDYNMYCIRKFSKSNLNPFITYIINTFINA